MSLPALIGSSPSLGMSIGIDMWWTIYVRL